MTIGVIEVESQSAKGSNALETLLGLEILSTLMSGLISDQFYTAMDESREESIHKEKIIRTIESSTEKIQNSANTLSSLAIMLKLTAISDLRCADATIILAPPVIYL